MKNVWVFTVCVVLLAGAALANEPLPYLTATPSPVAGGGSNNNHSDAILEDNLNNAGSNTYNNGLAGCAYFSSWLAFDFQSTTAVTVRHIILDYVYNSSPLKNTINFRLYQGTTPAVGSIVRSWDVPAANYTETNTGWVAFARPVYRSYIPIPDQALTANTKYWFAYTSPNSGSANIIYWLVWTQLKRDEVWWYLNSRWGTGSSQGAGGTYDQSYRLDDVITGQGLAPASLGKVKALFN
jgi:hypothetical protein